MQKSMLVAPVLCCIATAVVASQSMVEEGRDCAMAGNHDCAFEIFTTLAKSGDWPLADENDVLLLSGAMLEASAIDAAENWTPEDQKNHAQTYLQILKQQNPVSVHGYGTAHALMAFACRDLEDGDCFSQHVQVLCDKSADWSAPMGNHPKYADFVGSVAQLMNNECEVSQ